MKYGSITHLPEPLWKPNVPYMAKIAFFLKNLSTCLTTGSVCPKTDTFLPLLSNKNIETEVSLISHLIFCF